MKDCDQDLERVVTTARVLLDEVSRMYRGECRDTSIMERLLVIADERLATVGLQHTLVLPEMSFDIRQRPLRAVAA